MALVFPSSPTPGQTYAAPNGITYTWDNTLGVWTASANSLAAASLAEAATGTINTKFSSPQTAVPKDASGMTGAALIPTGTTLQQPSSPVAGMLRMNTTLNPDSLEVYDGTAATWRSLSYATATPTGLTDLTISANGPLPGGVYNNITIDSGVTATVGGLVSLTAYGSVTINGTINGIGKGVPGGKTSLSLAGVSVNAVGGVSGQGAGAGILAGTFAAPVSIGGQQCTPNYLLGSGGSSSTVFCNPGGGGVDTASEGGRAGASLLIKCKGTLTVSGTATIDVSGSGGFSESGAGGFAGGAGGGSGGLIYLEAETLSIAGTLNSKGGSGSNGINVSSAGGGGSGGYIIKSSPSTIVDTSTKSVAGGVAGAGAAGVGAGGGFGGVGGVGGAAGSAGQILTNYYL